MSLSRRLFGKAAVGGVVAGPAIAKEALSSESYEWKRLKLEQLVQDKARSVALGMSKGLETSLWDSSPDSEFDIVSSLINKIPREKLYKFAIKHGLTTEEEILLILRNDMLMVNNELPTPYKSFAEHTKMRIHNQRVLRRRLERIINPPPREEQIDSIYDLSIEIGKRMLARGMEIEMLTDA
jgi:hypothetical protein